MTLSVRLVTSAAALFAASILVAGCTASPGGSEPTSTSTPGDKSPVDNGDEHDLDDIEAAWLDGGRQFAVVTWGSSTCVPGIPEISADGQTVNVTLDDAVHDASPCTKDLAPRATTGAVPAGVDPTKDVRLVVTYGDVTDDVDLEGNAALTGVPGSPTDSAPSAGWFDDEGVVLLTWGSSGCPPIVENVDEQAGGATVTFATEDRVCTMDIAPRVTVLGFSGDVEDDSDFVLTLVGDNLDGTVNVLRG